MLQAGRESTPKKICIIQFLKNVNKNRVNSKEKEEVIEGKVKKITTDKQAGFRAGFGKKDTNILF